MEQECFSLTEVTLPILGCAMSDGFYVVLLLFSAPYD